MLGLRLKKNKILLSPLIKILSFTLVISKDYLLNYKESLMKKSLV